MKRLNKSANSDIPVVNHDILYEKSKEYLESEKNRLEVMVDKYTAALKAVKKELAIRKFLPIEFDKTLVKFDGSVRGNPTGILSYDYTYDRVLFIPYKKDGSLADRHYVVISPDDVHLAKE